MVCVAVSVSERGEERKKFKLNRRGHMNTIAATEKAEING